MTEHDAFDDLMAAYALDAEALDPESRQRADAHLATCDECRRTLAELRRVTAAVGLGVDAIEPPASLRARTISRATAVRQAPLGAAAIGPVARTAARPSPARHLGWLAFAAAVVALAGLGLYASRLKSELGQAQQTLASMTDRVTALRTELMSARLDSARLVSAISVLRSTDLVRVDLRGQGTAPGASGRAFVSAAHGLIFNADHLPQLAASRTYQLWVVPPGAAPVSAGVFTPDATGSSTLAMPLPSGVQLVAAVAVTEEPAGGSVKATTPPLLLGALHN